MIKRTIQMEQYLTMWDISTIAALSNIWMLITQVIKMLNCSDNFFRQDKTRRKHDWMEPHFIRTDSLIYPTLPYKMKFHSIMFSCLVLSCLFLSFLKKLSEQFNILITWIISIQILDNAAIVEMSHIVRYCSIWIVLLITFYSVIFMQYLI